jgi:hypothetical protein
MQVFFITTTATPKYKVLCWYGGKIVFPVSNHLRLGTEGYVTSYNYKNNEGFYKWVGVVCYSNMFQKYHVDAVLGVAVGGGGIKICIRFRAIIKIMSMMWPSIKSIPPW